VAVFDVAHADPVARARAAAVRSSSERERAVRDRAAGQTMADRLREGFRLARFADRLRRASR
jgi:hypothetical protein